MWHCRSYWPRSHRTVQRPCHLHRHSGWPHGEWALRNKWYRPWAARECSYEPVNVLGGCIPYTSTCTVVVRFLDSSHCDKLQARHPPSSDRSKSTSPIGPPDLSVGAPTIPKCRSQPPKMRPFSPITPEAPTRNPPSERQPVSIFSPHSHSSSSTSIAPPSSVPPRPRRETRLAPRPCDLRCARRSRCKREWL